MTALIGKYQNGFRLVTGESLNKLVNAINNLTGNGSAQPVSASTLNVSGAATFGAGATFIPGSAVTGTFAPSGNISTNVTVTNSASQTASQTLMSYSLPANALSGNQGVIVRAWGITGAAGAAGNKIVQLNIGGKSISSSTTNNSVNWQFTGYYFRSGVNAQVALLNGIFSTTALTPISQTDSNIDGSALTISVTCSTGSASAGDVVQQGLIVEYFK